MPDGVVLEAVRREPSVKSRNSRIVDCDQAARFATVLVAELAVRDDSRGVAECDLGSLRQDRLGGA